VQKAKFEGFPGEKFSPVILPGLASMRLIIQAVDEKNFPANASVRVDVGRRGDKRVNPIHDSSVSLFGLKSALPPEAQS
jgi:hypothetical protein